jgi:hypothetical protein
LRLIEDAGEHGTVAARLLAHHGEKAVALAGSRRSLTLIARHGDAAAEAILKHPGIAEPLIETPGQPGMNALNAIGARGGRDWLKWLKTARYHEVAERVKCWPPWSDLPIGLWTLFGGTKAH